MAGHREGKPTRKARRIEEHKRRIHEAPTGRAQVAAAFARYRSAAVRHPAADRELHAMATYLVTQADRLERTAA
jgi:hypothetical protein